MIQNKFEEFKRRFEEKKLGKAIYGMDFVSDVMSVIVPKKYYYILGENLKDRSERSFYPMVAKLSEVKTKIKQLEESNKNHDKSYSYFITELVKWD